MTVLHDEVVDRPLDDAPASPAKPDWKVAFNRARTKFSQDQGTDLAAALTYFSVQSIFPALIAVMSLLNIFGNGHETTTKLVASLARIAGKTPEDLKTVTDVIDSIQKAPGGGVALIVGIAGALWSASGYVGAFGRAMNRIYAVPEGRGFVKMKATLLAVTAIEIVMILVVVAAIVTSGGIAKEIGGSIGLGDTAVLAWDIAKWPFVALIVVGIISMLYNYTPNVKRAKYRLFSSGAAVGFVVWVLASIALAAYIGFTQGASYQKTYGAFAGAIIFLLWLWITNIAMLFGAELDAELLRTKQLKSGLPAERLILLPARDSEGIVKKEEKDEKMVDDAIDLRLDSTPADDALARHQGGANDDARRFGLAVGPSSHGRISTPSAPLDTKGGGARAVHGESREERELTEADVERARAARLDDHLVRAEQERKVRDRREAQQRKIQAKEAKRLKKRQAEEKAREEATPLAAEWEAVDAVRAQFEPRPTPAREEMMAERAERRAAYRAEQRERAARLAQPGSTAMPKPKHAKKDDGDEREPVPSALRTEVDAERAKRRDDWYTRHGL